jgi:hypothetical protein
MKRTFNVKVEVNSFSPPRVYLGTHRVRLSSGNPRKGSKTMIVAGNTLQAKLKFTAPAETDWSFKVEEETESEDGTTMHTTLLDKSGESDVVNFEFTKPLTLSPRPESSADLPPADK